MDAFQLLWRNILQKINIFYTTGIRMGVKCWIVSTAALITGWGIITTVKKRV